MELDRTSYSVSETARLVGVSDETVRRWVRRGEVSKMNLPGGAIRIPRSAVEKLLKPVHEADITE